MSMNAQSTQNFDKLTLRSKPVSRLRNLFIKASVLHPFVHLFMSVKTMPQHRTEHLTGSIQQKKIRGVAMGMGRST